MSESPPEAELNILNGLFDSGRFAEVIDRGEKLLARFPESFVLYQLLGTANGILGRNDGAVEYFRETARIKPEFLVAHLNLGIALISLGRNAEAIASFENALELKPDCAEAHYSLGAALHALGQLEAAAGAYEKALEISPGYEAHYNMGIVLAALGRNEGAIIHFQEARQIAPNASDAHYHLAVSLQAAGHMAEAVASYNQALTIQPDFVQAHHNLGNVFQSVGRMEDAVTCYERAIAIQPGLSESHHNLGAALQVLGRRDEAIASYDRALKINPNFASARSQRLHQLAQICDWDALSAESEIIKTLGTSGDAVMPFAMLAFDDDPRTHRIRSENYIENWHPGRRSYPVDKPKIKPQILKIGYFSSDFYNHATMYLMAKLFELHDRGRFAVHAFAYGAARNDEMRHKLRNAVDGFHDVGSMGDSQAADLARLQGIDIAVDLKGFTTGTRLGIFACRAAPIQMSYLGYPGTLGAPYMDYLIADKVVIPADQRQHYCEKIIFLPDSYQVNDSSRAISDRMMKRAEMGLPQQGFVFCCFNNLYKISPVEFDIWMRLLRQVEGSVLWLLGTNRSAEQNLRKEARKRSIEPDRLVFAAQMPLPDHLARHRLADLFLDTFNYNAHTTASDALWAGLPMVTRLGQGFAARVAGSLLTAVGLPELITTTSEDYELLALELARDPDRLSRIRAKLASNRLTAPLFDTQLFTRHIEAAYERAYESYFEGRPPADIMV